MRHSIWILSIAALLLLSHCGQDKEKKDLLQKIADLESVVYADSVAQLDPVEGQKLLQSYNDYADAYPDDSITPEYLFKGAEIAMNLKMTGQAIEEYQRVVNHYPDAPKASYSLFMQAFFYENQIKQYDVAKKLYQSFLDKYPDHELAEDARMSIQYMGKPLEDLIKSWEKQNSK